MSETTDLDDIRETVRRRYAAAATLSSGGEHGKARALKESSCCGAPVPGSTDEEGCTVFGADLCSPGAPDGANEAAVAASLGCGVPTAVADLHPGETVLDLGSGAGTDVLISARRVGPAGKAIGLDMTAEMLDLDRLHRRRPHGGGVSGGPDRCRLERDCHHRDPSRSPSRHQRAHPRPQARRHS